jgi:hypothetical protein
MRISTSLCVFATSVLMLLLVSGCQATNESKAPNGFSASSSLARVLGPALADDCPYGGVELEYGIDTNNDGSLDDIEVNGSYSICHGEPGKPGETCKSVDTGDRPGPNCPKRHLTRAQGRSRVKGRPRAQGRPGNNG